MKDSEKIKEIEDTRIVKVYLDDEVQPFAEFAPPVQFVLDTTKIPDGEHKLKIIANSSNNVEGVRIIPFKVQNGPEISVEGLDDNETINTQTAVVINAYGSETNDRFIIRGSENTKPIPAWIWAMCIAILAFGLYYGILYWTPEFYKSFF